MRCLFCKQDSSTSKSVEHIIPASLGNTKHVLPAGYVCDKCNNYFATKIEKKVLEQPYFRSVRHRNDIPTKKGKAVAEKGIAAHPQGGPIDIYVEGGKLVVVASEKIFDLVASGQIHEMYMPIGEPQPSTEENGLFSRLLAKMAVEAMLFWIKDDPDWITEIMNRPELEDIKKYARYGGIGKFWPYKQRRLYNEGDYFLNPELRELPYEILHEFKFLWTEEMECYFVIAIMGIEYAMNMVGPSTATYERWLKENNAKSVLVSDKV